MKLIGWLKRKYMRYCFSNEQYARKIGVNIGENCQIGSRNFGAEPYLVTIGNHVQITDNVYFFTHGSGWVFRNEIPDFDFFGKIVIKDNVYIGSGACLLPGVTVGSNVIIGARSVVTKSIPDGVVVGGNPARIICTLEESKQKLIEYNLGTKKLTAKNKRRFLSNLPTNKFVIKSYLKK